jgi:hypothetical protein
MGLVAVLALVATVTGMGTAQAAPTGFSSVPLASWRAVGPGYATLVVGDTVYVGGSFSTVTSPDGSLSVPRANLAAFSATTGALLDTFRADTNGAVRALAYDGTNLYVGGSFGTIGGVSRGKLAALDPTTGAVRSWRANANGAVYALSTSADTLYVGGAFSTVKGIARSHVAGLRLSDSALTPLSATFDNTVRSIAAASDNSAVYAGGPFKTVNGVAKSFLVKLDATGATAPVAFSYLGGQVLDLQLSADGTRLAAAVGGQGRYTNQGAWYDTDTGTKYFNQHCDGDGQAVYVLGGNLFTGFHEGCNGDGVTRLTSNDLVTGARDMTFAPTFNQFWGVRDIGGDLGHLVIAGEFTNVSGVPVQGFAIFPGL